MRSYAKPSSGIAFPRRGSARGRTCTHPGRRPFRRGHIGRSPRNGRCPGLDRRGGPRMNARVPLRDLAHFRLLAPRVDQWTENISWIPVSFSELHLVCRYFPIVVRTAGEQPRLGVCLDDRLLARPTRDALGHWRVPYRPIAMRCFPFESRGISDNPLDDILIDPHSRYLSLVDGTPIIDETGRPARFIAGLRQLLGLLKRSEETFAALLDHYHIA